MNKRGMTLMELLVYMAIVGIVVLVAGTAFTNSTKMRVRTEGKLNATALAEEVGALFRDDVAQMGAKTMKNASGAYETKTDVMMGPSNATPDYSSFKYEMNKNNDGTYGDELTFRRIAYSDNGSFLRVEEISWFLEDDVLKRSCKTISGTPDASLCKAVSGDESPSVVDIVEGVKNFMITPARPSELGTEGIMFPNYADASKKSFQLISYGGDSYFVKAASVANSSGFVTLAGFTTNYKSDGSSVTDPLKHQFFLADDAASILDWKNCTAFTFSKGKIYEVSFEMGNQEDNSRMFRPGVDHMAVGIRYNDAGVPTAFPDVPDFLFYPPEDDAGTGVRTMRFSINSGDAKTYNACVALTFAFYSPTVASGSMVISNMQVRRIVDAEYYFVDEYDPNTTDRNSIHAIRMKLDVIRNNEHGQVEVVVPVPSNGTKG